jgi:hypothetical protein
MYYVPVDGNFTAFFKLLSMRNIYAKQQDSGQSKSHRGNTVYMSNFKGCLVYVGGRPTIRLRCTQSSLCLRTHTYKDEHIHSRISASPTSSQLQSADSKIQPK